MTKLTTSIGLLIAFHVAQAAQAHTPVNIAAVNEVVTPQFPTERFEVFVGVKGDQGGKGRAYKVNYHRFSTVFQSSEHGQAEFFIRR